MFSRKLIPLALLACIGLVHAVPLESRDLPDDYDGKFIITVEAIAKDGKADELQKLVSTVRAHSTNPQLEPETLTYRVARGFGDESNKFTLIEEYANKKAWEYHMTTQEYQNLINSGTFESVTQSFSKEFF
ncbi:hypothetical protein PM082_006521 [Marasmius tenuissimus]|nr:hypothetical protein PM082_006521 [Marasmius tenuissimus]